MKTKIEIIQKLLDDRHITAQDAMTLMQTEKEYIYYPLTNYPQYPAFPTYPFYTSGDTSSELIYKSN